MKASLLLVFITFSSLIFAQKNIIQEANKLGEEWKYEEAIHFLQEKIKTDSANAELYYWLGRYSHYIVYDTRPFSNKSDNWSKEQVLKNLKKAVELDPKYGDAKYFLAAEYGARALEALKANDTTQYKKELLDAYECGGFPLHIIEHGKNILRSCEPNSILLVNGDAQFNIIQYIQVIEGIRKDVSLIVLALLERPYYIKLIRDGIPNILKASPLNLSDNLIMEMHVYKWRENDILIPISDRNREEFHVNDSIKNFKWTVKPDFGKKKLRTSTAMLINILESNKDERPIHYSLFGFSDINGLEDYMQIAGLSAKVSPIKVKGLINEYDREKFESVMFNPDNYKGYHDIAINYQPRVSYSIGNTSRIRILEYATYLFENNEIEKAKWAIEKMNELMPVSDLPLPSYIEKDLNVLIEKLN